MNLVVIYHFPKLIGRSSKFIGAKVNQCGDWQRLIVSCEGRPMAKGIDLADDWQADSSLR